MKQQQFNSFDSEHNGIIHDAQYDYFGLKVATAGSDGQIFIFEANLDDHDGSVWQLAWAHPKFGSLIASCGFDRKVCIWKDFGQNKWEKVYNYENHKNSVNSIAFAPHEYGLILLCGSSDGSFSLHEYKNDQWNNIIHEGHTSGINTVSWGPALYPISFQNDDNSNTLAPMRFVTGGCDNNVKVWTNTSNSEDISKATFTLENLEGHTDWVRDVAWLNYVGYAYDLIASCSEDEYVYLWTKKDDIWVKTLLKKFNTPIWRVSWSQCGSYLAVSSADNSVYMFKENIDGKWEIMSRLNQEGNLESL